MGKIYDAPVDVIFDQVNVVQPDKAPMSFGVWAYWIVEPVEKKVEVYVLKGGQYNLDTILRVFILSRML